MKFCVFQLGLDENSADSYIKFENNMPTHFLRNITNNPESIIQIIKSSSSNKWNVI